MNITSKSRYALKILMDIAAHSDSDPVRREQIVQRQGIPAKYLDQIVMLLRRAGLVLSMRGCAGGYRLQRDSREISVWDIIVAVEDSVLPALCVQLDTACGHQDHCTTKDAWHLIFATIRQPLEAICLEDLLQRLSNTGLEPLDAVLATQECLKGGNPYKSENTPNRGA